MSFVVGLFDQDEKILLLLQLLLLSVVELEAAKFRRLLLLRLGSKDTSSGNILSLRFWRVAQPSFISSIEEYRRRRQKISQRSAEQKDTIRFVQAYE